jgi:3-isopropylmalate/(R)-2-methylmalate dehydratase small subunit
VEILRVHEGLVAALDKVDVDTDQIIPKQFLKRVERTGFGEFLFFDWRSTADGEPNPEFVLNQPRYAGATVLVTGRNFGCGSSREHAVWALMQFGFRAIIAPSFADIFSNNSSKNGLALIKLPPEQVTDLLQRATKFGNYRVKVDLENCRVTDAQGFSAPFVMDDDIRKRLLEGLDDIAITLQHEAEIRQYEDAAAAR